MHDMKNTLMRFHLILLNSKKYMTLMLIVDDNFINSKLHLCLTAPALSPGTKYVFYLMCICLFCKQLRSLTDLKCNSGIIIIFLCKCFPWSAHLWYHHLLIGGYASTNMIILSHFFFVFLKLRDNGLTF